MAIELGATFVGRSFSGHKKQLSAMMKAALAHNGTVMLDVVSPCVTFNDHEGSTKSYKYMKDHDEPIHEVSFVPFFEDISVDYEPGSATEVTMHDGSHLMLRKLEEDYDPGDRIRAIIVEVRKDACTGNPYVVWMTIIQGANVHKDRQFSLHRYFKINGKWQCVCDVNMKSYDACLSVLKARMD